MSDTEKKALEEETKATDEAEKKKPSTKAELEAAVAALLEENEKLKSSKPASEAFVPNDPKRPVTLELPYDGDKYKDDLYVNVNNNNWQIKRGVPVTVPFYVAQAVKESAEQDKATARLIAIREIEYNRLVDSKIL